MSDVEDPELYAAQPIWQWQQTDMGKWVMEHAEGPTFSIHNDPMTYGHRVTVYGLLNDKDHTYFMLKYGHNKSNR